MNIEALLKSTIYLISASALYPALFLLVCGFIIVVASLGAFTSEWAERKRLSQSGKSRPALLRDRKYTGISGTVIEDLDEILSIPGATWYDVENLWKSFRLARWRKLDYLRILARLGPAMGLVGTLIPMSTGLASLSQGDTSGLSSDLVVAFSTTVVGLCYGVAAHILFIIRGRWLEEDLETLRIVVESRAASVLDAHEGAE